MLKNLLNTEEKRKILHIVSGAVFLILLFFFGRTKFVILLIALLLGGLIVINMVLLKIRVPFSGWFIRNFERSDVRFPGYSTAWYLAGILIAASILPIENEIAGTVCALAFGDGISSLIGKKGKHKLFYNKNKTIEGVVGFFVGTLLSIFFVGWIAIPFAFITAIFESLPLKIDDNFSVPLFATVFFYIF